MIDTYKVSHGSADVATTAPLQACGQCEAQISDHYCHLCDSNYHQHLRRPQMNSFSRASDIKSTVRLSKLNSPYSSDLPPVDGPKLGPFRFPTRISKIEWLERLGITDGSESEHGYIFHIKIEQRHYAIKVFKYYDPRRHEAFWEPLWGEKASLNKVSHYLDPFYSECRAYGRIQQCIEQQQLSQNIAVPCHGYIFLGDKDKRMLIKKYKIDLSISNPKYQKNATEKMSLRAIIKDLAPPKSGVDQNNITTIARNLVKLNKKGKIYNRDIRLANYRDGKLVDFGAAMTEPHEMLDDMEKETSDIYRDDDQAMFSEMMEDEELVKPAGIKALLRLWSTKH